MDLPATQRRGREPRDPIEGGHRRATADLRARIAHYRALARQNAVWFTVYLRLLYDLQDFGTYQAEIRRFSRLIGRDRFAQLRPKEAQAVLRMAEFAALPVEEIASLLAALRERVPAEAGLAGGLAEAYAATAHRLRVRRAIGQRYEGRFTLISLGLHCLPWLVPNRWGLRAPEDFVGTYNPFALAKHRYRSLVADLAGDLADYAPPDALTSVTTPGGFTVALRSDRGAVWNHNKGDFWSQDDHAELKRDLAEKVAAFRRSARAPNPVFLLGGLPFDWPDAPVERLEELKAALARFTGGDYHLLLSNQRETRFGTACVPVDERVSCLYCPYPSPDYVWQDEDTGNAPEGLLYEQRYVALVVRALADWGLMVRRRPGVTKKQA